MYVLTELIGSCDGERPFVSLIGTYDTIDEARRKMRRLYSSEIRSAIRDGWINDVLHGEYDCGDYLSITGNKANVFTDYRHYELNIFDSKTRKFAQ